MATTTLKVLGQSNPAAGTLTDAYTVPGVTQATATSVVVCNQSSVAKAKFRISVAVAGAADAVKQYLYYDIEIDPSDTFAASLEATLGAADVVRVYSNRSDTSFTVFGAEVA